jgi:quercetin dioxygenase-like cupin family protein
LAILRPGENRRVDDDQAALARCVGDVERFASDDWGRRPRRFTDRGSFVDLLSTDDVEQLLAGGARRPSFRLVRDGATLPPADWTRSVRMGGSVVDDAADLARIVAAAATGATVVLQGLHHLWPPLQRFCARLERATSHRVQANAYLSPAGAAGLAHHADTHEVLVLQVEGMKAWDVDGLGPLTLAAGDVLYLPAGTGHAARAQQHHSLHVTIGVLATTFRHVVRRVLDGFEELERPLPIGFARPGQGHELAEELACTLKTSVEQLIALDPDALGAEEIARTALPARPMAPGTLRAVVDSSAVGDHTRLHRDPRMSLSIEDRGDTAVLVGDARRLHVPAAVRPALEVVVTRTTLTVGELAELDATSRAVLARRLLRDGFLELAPSN